jgi:hypothetical protein
MADFPPCNGLMSVFHVVDPSYDQHISERAGGYTRVVAWISRTATREMREVDEPHIIFKGTNHRRPFAR